MKDVQVRLTTTIAITIIASAGAFAAGRSTSSPPPAVSTTTVHADPSPAPEHEHDHGSDFDDSRDLPPNHPPVGGDMQGGDLPPGHPAVGNGSPGAAPAAAPGETSLSWTVPSRWQTMPNSSSMRLATYKVPRATGDTADGDVSVMQAGGGIDANVDRWIGQFGPDAKAKSKRTSKTINNLKVTIVEAEGSYGGMGDKVLENAGLLGAIVETPGMPHFFKITGPKRTVQSARAELDTLLSSIAQK